MKVMDILFDRHHNGCLKRPSLYRLIHFNKRWVSLDDWSGRSLLRLSVRFLKSVTNPISVGSRKALHHIAKCNRIYQNRVLWTLKTVMVASLDDEREESVRSHKL